MGWAERNKHDRSSRSEQGAGVSGPQGIINPSRNVQIIGMPAIRAWFPTALLNCACQEKGAILLQGFNNPAQCPACGEHFVISKIVPMPGGQVGVEIGKVTVIQNAQDNGRTVSES
jgi:hypothetical protein